MRAGIIAAGLGSRLKASFPGSPKPLVPVGGRPLVHWTVSSLTRAGVRSVTMLVNSEGGEVRRYLKAEFPAVAWTFLQRDTPSSLESFRLVAGMLARSGTDPFLVSTVDALVPPAETARFAAEALRATSSGWDAALALTAFVDDEKPLWADLAEGGRVTALGDDAPTKRLVTCGLYALSVPMACSIETVPARNRRAGTAGADGAAAPRLRDWWGLSLKAGRKILGVELSKTLDVDRPEDLREAEAFVSEVLR